nr:PGF-CTERM sorting domain-containing protein [Salarchaeum sp. JOR-1]
MRERIHALAMTVVLIGSVLAVAPGAAAGATAGGASVTFDAQTSGGYTVTVENVTLPDGGFVTIHDASVTEGNVLGSVVGSSTYLEAGTHESVTVRLDEPLSEDGTYVAMPHMDTNDNRVYEFVSANANADGPYTMSGSAVVDTANVTVSASVSMSDQPTGGNSVVVDRVELSEGGFVAVHDSTLLDGEVTGSVVGHSQYLSAGVHENVRITLNASVGNETVIAMPHMDTNGDEAYTFVESGGETDGPFLTMDDSAVLDTASATVTSEAMVSAENQTTGGHTVTVESVFVPAGGFVTIHDATVTEGAVFDSVRGTSDYLAPGLHRNVQVTLDDPLANDTTIVAMPHKDTDDDMAYTFVESEGATDGPYTSDGSAVVDTATATVSASVTMNTQESGGHTVVVESVDLSDGGFVTIHDSSLFAGDVFGSVVGTSDYLEAGYHEDVEVTLSTPANESQVLVAMAHQDTNGDTTYSFVESEGATDGPYTANGGAVVDTAKALVNAVVVADDQQTDGTTVTVDSVTLANGGFVTIHDSTLADGAVLESVVGTSQYLSAGTHENVTVQLDAELSGEQTVFAMAHKDTNGDMAYSFVQSEGATDGPYVQSGMPVMQSLSVDAPGQTTTTMDEMTTTMDEMTTTMDETDASGSTPGFGVGLALIAVLGAALLALRRD